MRIMRDTGEPYLWKSVPYAIEPVAENHQIYYAFGYNRSQFIGVGLFVFITLAALISSVIALGKHGLGLAASVPGAYTTLSVLAVLLCVMLVLSYKAVVILLRRSQVCVHVDGKTAQIQYNFRDGLSASPAVIIVQSTVIESDGKPSIEERLLEKTNPSLVSRDVSLVVIANLNDFEIVGAFKSLETALDFAEIVQSQTGLDVVDQELSMLRSVSGGRGFGFLSTDSRAIRKRHQAKPFK
jgi:hypothetical protein